MNWKRLLRTALLFAFVSGLVSCGTSWVTLPSLLPDETPSKKPFDAIYSTKKIKQGEVLTKDNVEISTIPAGKVPRSAMFPDRLEMVVGKHAQFGMDEGQIVSYYDLIEKNETPEANANQE